MSAWLRSSPATNTPISTTTALKTMASATTKFLPMVEAWGTVCRGPDPAVMLGSAAPEAVYRR